MPPPRNPSTLERLSHQVALVDAQVVEVQHELHEHLRDHRQAVEAARQAAQAAKATAAVVASRNQMRVTIGLAVLGPVVTAGLLRFLHLG